MPKPERQRSLGFAGVELSNADQKLTELSTIFADAADTSDRLGDLADSIDNLQSTFERLRISVQQTNRPFEGYDSFEGTLRNCELFIQCFKPERTGQRWLHIDGHAAELEAQIMMQISLMSTSIIVLLAETFFSNDDREPGASKQVTQPTKSGQHEPEPDRVFEEKWAKIKRVVYRRKRKPLSEPTSNTGPVKEFEDLEKEMKNDLRQLMLKHQPLIPNATSRPQFQEIPQSQHPLNLEALPDDKLLERTRQKERHLLSVSRQLPFPAPPARVWTLRGDDNQSVVSRKPDPPTLRNGSIHIQFAKSRKSHHYKLSEINPIMIDKKRKLRCVNIDETVTIIHDLPLKGKRYPTTLHSEVEGVESSVVLFDKQLWAEINTRTRTAGDAFIKYNFSRPEDLKLFQERVREKELLRTFSVIAITSDAGLEMSYQHLKLWNDHKTGEYTLSFYKNVAAEKEHLEFSLCMLELATIKEPKNDQIVRLDFVSEAPLPRRSLSDGPHGSSPGSRKRNSVSSLNTILSDTTIKHTEYMRTLGVSMKFLSIELSGSEDALTLIKVLKPTPEAMLRDSISTFGDSVPAFSEPSTFSNTPQEYVSTQYSSVTPGYLEKTSSSTNLSLDSPTNPGTLIPGTLSTWRSSSNIRARSTLRRRRDYTVGWICALPIEMSAAIAVLDERHHPLSQDSMDLNAYVIGRIGGHNIVITCLPAGMTGNNSAASVATQMKYSFRHIKIRLMVGIGGGVPSARDIRLGDVVVSKPGANDGGVVQYDFGKTTAGGVFQKTGQLPPPPSELLSAISLLEAIHDNDGSKIPEYLKAFDMENMRLKFGHPGTDRDELFTSDYDHVPDQSTCASCDQSRLQARPPRKAIPVVHYGTVASGNQVMRDAKSRDELGRKLGVLCFEMEAAGLMNMNTFPCIVIRGICDYADTHKNKEWQGYAAATAAAYAKELLMNIPPSEGQR